MAHNGRFECGDIEARLKGFLEDMLSEEEYALFAAHLRECRRCREHASSIGSLSNDVRALADILHVPADLEDTVMFKMSHSGGDKARVGGRRTVVFITGIVFAVMAGMAAYGVFRGPVLRHDRPLPAAQARNAVSAPVVEAKDDFFTDAGGGAAPAEVPAKPVAAVSGPFALHWHLKVSDADEKGMLSVISALGISVEHRSAQLIVVSGSARDMKRLRLALDDGGAQRLSAKEVAAADDAQGRATIVLEQAATGTEAARGAALVSLETRRAAAHVHWHVLLVLPKKEELFSVIRNAGGLLEFESGADVVFSVPQAEMAGLPGKVKGLDGVIIKLSEGDPGRAGTGRVMLSLYLQEG